eukprot:870154-Pyramimonas_sp.AAC.1
MHHNARITTVLSYVAQFRLIPGWLLNGELVALSRSSRLPLGALSLPLALSLGAFLRTAYRALPEFNRLYHWLHRQHHRLGDLRTLAQAASSRPCPALWKLEAFVETLYNVQHGLVDKGHYSSFTVSAARSAAEAWLAEPS